VSTDSKRRTNAGGIRSAATEGLNRARSSQMRLIQEATLTPRYLTVELSGARAAV